MMLTLLVIRLISLATAHTGLCEAVELVGNPNEAKDRRLTQHIKHCLQLLTHLKTALSGSKIFVFDGQTVNGYIKQINAQCSI